MTCGWELALGLAIVIPASLVMGVVLGVIASTDIEEIDQGEWESERWDSTLDDYP